MRKEESSYLPGQQRRPGWSTAREKKNWKGGAGKSESFSGRKTCNVAGEPTFEKKEKNRERQAKGRTTKPVAKGPIVAKKGEDWPSKRERARGREGKSTCWGRPGTKNKSPAAPLWIAKDGEKEARGRQGGVAGTNV